MAVTATPTTSGTTAAVLPIRPPRWVRVWVGALGVIAVAVAVLVGVPVAASERFAMLAPVAVAVVLALLLAWRVGGLAAGITADGALRIRNRQKTYLLTRAEVRRIRVGRRPNRGATPCATVELQNGTEITVDASLTAAFQSDQLAAQVAALEAWRRAR